MRTTDPDPQPSQPLGQKVKPQSPPAAAPAQQVAPGIKLGADGRLYTELPLPKAKP